MLVMVIRVLKVEKCGDQYCIIFCERQIKYFKHYSSKSLEVQRESCELEEKLKY